MLTFSQRWRLNRVPVRSGTYNFQITMFPKPQIKLSAEINSWVNFCSPFIIFTLAFRPFWIGRCKLIRYIHVSKTITDLAWLRYPNELVICIPSHLCPSRNHLWTLLNVCSGVKGDVSSCYGFSRPFSPHFALKKAWNICKPSWAQETDLQFEL